MQKHRPGAVTPERQYRTPPTNHDKYVYLLIAMNIIYDRISTLCTQFNITPGKLCTELGISRGIITDLKMGRKKDLNATTAYKIAKHLGVSVGYLLGFEDK